MKISKKTLLIILIPVLLTLFFVTRILLPAITNYTELKNKFEETQKAYIETQTNLKELQNNKKILKELEDLNNQVPDFDIQIPSSFEDEFFLVDLSKFAFETTTRIISLNTKAEKELKINNLNEKQDKKSKKPKKGKKKKTEEPAPPLTIHEKPFEIITLGNYNKIIDFVSCLENYQRKFIINGISAEISKNDENNPNPKIEIKIEGSTFKAVKNTTETESEPEKTE